MPEAGGDEPVTGDLVLDPVHPSAGEAHLALEVADCGVDRGLVRGDDFTGHRARLAQPVEDRDRLRGPEREVQTRQLRPRQPLVAARRPSFEHGGEVRLVDHPGEVQQLGARSHPTPGGFAPAGVVVLDALGDRQVVGLLAGGHQSDVQHDEMPPLHVPTPLSRSVTPISRRNPRNPGEVTRRVAAQVTTRVTRTDQPE